MASPSASLTAGSTSTTRRCRRPPPATPRSSTSSLPPAAASTRRGCGAGPRRRSRGRPARRQLSLRSAQRAGLRCHRARRRPQPGRQPRRLVARVRRRRRPRDPAAVGRHEPERDLRRRRGDAALRPEPGHRPLRHRQPGHRGRRAGRLRQRWVRHGFVDIAMGTDASRHPRRRHHGGQRAVRWPDGRRGARRQTDGGSGLLRHPAARRRLVAGMLTLVGPATSTWSTSRSVACRRSTTATTTGPTSTTGPSRPTACSWSSRPATPARGEHRRRPVGRHGLGLRGGVDHRTTWKSNYNSYVGRPHTL